MTAGRLPKSLGWLNAHVCSGNTHWTGCGFKEEEEEKEEDGGEGEERRKKEREKSKPASQGFFVAGESHDED